MSKLSKKESRIRRHRRLRQKLSGTAEVPRLSVFRSDCHIYVQVIDDVAGRTILSVSTVEKVFREEHLAANVKSAQIIGKTVAERALAAGLKKVVYDRGGFAFHGCIKALADAAREAGLEF